VILWVNNFISWWRTPPAPRRRALRRAPVVSASLVRRTTMFAFATTSTATPVAKVCIRILFYRTSRSHVSTSTWDDASGARWMTDDEASVFPPTWSRAMARVEREARVEAPRARCGRANARGSEKVISSVFAPDVACARNATIARRAASERAGRSRDDVDGSREWLTCRG